MIQNATAMMTIIPPVPINIPNAGLVESSAIMVLFR